MQGGFRFLGSIFAVLLALPAASYATSAAMGLGSPRVQASDIALAGILATAATVVLSALNARTRTSLLAASAFVGSTGLVALAVAPTSARGFPQIVALGLFLLAGAAALALSAPPKTMASEASSTNAADS